MSSMIYCDTSSEGLLKMPTLSKLDVSYVIKPGCYVGFSAMYLLFLASCTVHPAVKHFQQACSKTYSWSNEDEGCYDVSWRPVNESTEECRKSNPDSHWAYHTAWQLKGTPFWGMFHNYWGGGKLESCQS